MLWIPVWTIPLCNFKLLSPFHASLFAKFLLFTHNFNMHYTQTHLVEYVLLSLRSLTHVTYAS